MVLAKMVAASRLVALACASATATAMKFDMATMKDVVKELVGDETKE